MNSLERYRGDRCVVIPGDAGCAGELAVRVEAERRHATGRPLQPRRLLAAAFAQDVQPSDAVEDEHDRGIATGGGLGDGLLAGAQEIARCAGDDLHSGGWRHRRERPEVAAVVDESAPDQQRPVGLYEAERVRRVVSARPHAFDLVGWIVVPEGFPVDLERGPSTKLAYDLAIDAAQHQREAGRV